MKKNAMLKIAAILMVAVLLTTCAISSTFAKYVSTKSTASTARVAKWGITMTASNNDSAFSKSYVDSKDQTVISSGDFVIAPGVKSAEAVSISITGTAEVATKIDVAGNKTSGKFVTLTGWGDEKACPLTFYVNNAPITAASTTALETAVNEEIAKTLKSVEFIAPNTPISQVITVGYSWDYETAGKSEVEQAAIDAIDTYFGELANTAGDAAPKVIFDFTATVTQVGESYVTAE